MSNAIKRLSNFLLTTGLLVAGASAAHADVNILGYTGIFSDKYIEAVVEPFTKATGIKVNYRPIQNSSQNLGLLRAEKSNPSIDLSIMDALVARAGNEEGLFEKLNPGTVSNMADLFPEALVNGEFGPAITFDHVVMIYNTDQVNPAPTAFDDMWKPENKGKVAFNGAPSIEAYMMLLLINRHLGGDEHKTVQPAIDHLAELAPSVMSFRPTPDPFTVVGNGTARIGMGWNARAQAYHDLSGGKLGIVMPAEGSVLQINTINLVAGAPNKEEALKFLNYTLSPEAQAAFTNAMFYGPTNKLAKPSEEAVSRTSASSKVRELLKPLDWDLFVAQREKWLELWRRQVAN